MHTEISQSFSCKHMHHMQTLGIALLSYYSGTSLSELSIVKTQIQKKKPTREEPHHTANTGPEEGKFEWSGHTCMRENFSKTMPTLN